jgi:hypothetical protein
VAGAARYEFQLAADAGFNSPVLGRGEDQFFTRNTRATLKKTAPNGTYYWRVRAATADGSVSPWAAPRQLRKGWTLAPALQAPAHGAIVSHPTNPLVLRWSSVPHAAKYLVTIASDPLLGSAVGGQQNVETGGSVYAPRSLLLPPGTYYWGVTPLDAQGHRGVPSPVASFTWTWPTATAPAVDDLMAETEVFDPMFSWAPVPGAAKYELEVNPTADFSPGSKVCCSETIIATSHSPTSMLRDNTYYWRVRTLDAFGNAGQWNLGTPFNKTFDKVPPVSAPSIKNVHLRDNLSDPGSDLDGSTAGYQTRVPILSWNPVPGASSYELDVFPYEGGMCNWSDLGTDHWRVVTATTAWTMLGSGWGGVKPYDDDRQVANDGIHAPVAGKSYCARVRARADRDKTMQEVYGDYTYLNDGTGASFSWLGAPAGGACSPTCVANNLGADDYVLPTTGTSTTRMPLFTWKPIAGKAAYYVLVAKDPSFSNIVDYAFTQQPAYAPRTGFAPTTYSDEETLYYWAVLPATSANGDGAVGNPLEAAPHNFQKLSVPPTLISPAAGSDVLGQPTFKWTSAEAARNYRLQVSQDPAFGTLLDDLTTASTAYTSSTSYPADTLLYWRVRAGDENTVGLRWSAVGNFQRRLPTPAPKFDTPAGDMFPLMSWAPIQGAVSYRLAVDEPDGDHSEFDDFRSAAATFTKMTGTGVAGIRLRANFPTKTGQTTSGPWSPTVQFTRTMSEPTGASTDASGDHLLFSWDPKPGAKQYRLLVSNREDFATSVEDVSTDNTSFAPVLTNPGYLQGGVFFWKVAAVDEDRNVGDFTRPHSFTLKKAPASGPGAIKVSQRLRIGLKGRLRVKRMSRVVVTVKAGGRAIAGAKVRGLGSGLKPRWRATNRKGQVVFRFRPKARGKVFFQATKRGYLVGAVQARIR